MGTFADLSDLVAALTTSGEHEDIPIWKDNRVAGAAAVATVAGRWTSLWQYEGMPSHGAAPTTAAVPDNTTAGALKQTDPGGGRQKYLTGADMAPSAGGGMLLYDRLAHIGNLSGTQTAAQAFTLTPTRYTTTESPGNLAFIEIYTAIGATGTTATMEYTDDAGNLAQVSPAFAIGGAGLQEAGRMIPISLASGDTGVRSVTNIDLVASTTTVGAFGVTIVRPLAMLFSYGAALGGGRDMLSGMPSLPEIKTGACLGLAWFANSTGAPNLFGGVHMAEA
jgi:hypothetical protein